MSDNSTVLSSHRSVASATHSRCSRSGSGCEGINNVGVRIAEKLYYKDQITVATWNFGGLSYTTRETMKDFFIDIPMVLTFLCLISLLVIEGGL